MSIGDAINSIGTIPGGFRCDYEQGARPRGATGLFDLLVEPYLRGLLPSSGGNRETFGTRTLGWKWYQSLQPVLRPHLFTGIYQCTRRGIEALYGIDLLKLDSGSLQQLESAIHTNYQLPAAWYGQAMNRSNFRGLIRPVHPEFYQLKESPESAAEEARLMRTVMRIDPFLDHWTLPAERRKRMSELAGIEPADARTWRAFLAWWFDKAAGAGASASSNYRRTGEVWSIPSRATKRSLDRHVIDHRNPEAPGLDSA